MGRSNMFGGRIDGAILGPKNHRRDYGLGAVVSVATAGNVTYTALQLLSGRIVRDPAGASRTDVLPTAALLYAALQAAMEGDPQIGDEFYCQMINGADAAETITLTAGSGMTYDTNQVAASRLIGQNASRLIICRWTAIGTPACNLYLF